MRAAGRMPAPIERNEKNSSLSSEYGSHAPKPEKQADKPVREEPGETWHIDLEKLFPLGRHRGESLDPGLERGAELSAMQIPLEKGTRTEIETSFLRPRRFSDGYFPA